MNSLKMQTELFSDSLKKAEKDLNNPFLSETQLNKLCPRCGLLIKDPADYNNQTKLCKWCSKNENSRLSQSERANNS